MEQVVGHALGHEDVVCRVGLVFQGAGDGMVAAPEPVPGISQDPSKEPVGPSLAEFDPSAWVVVAASWKAGRASRWQSA